MWQGEASGTRPGCRSPFGVYDMTGNVDEWTSSVNKSGYASILKGGYWGPVRARCRPSTRAHGEDFVAYQQGFRCCADPGPAGEEEDAGAAAPAPDAGADEPAPDAGASSADPVAPAGADLSAEWPEQDDELDAIARERSSMCSVSRPAGGAAGGFGLALLLAALAARARRQDRPRPIQAGAAGAPWRAR